jgi:hypothetical protein
MAYILLCNPTGATSGAATAYRSGTPELNFRFVDRFVLLLLVIVLIVL